MCPLEAFINHSVMKLIEIENKWEILVILEFENGWHFVWAMRKYDLCLEN